MWHRALAVHVSDEVLNMIKTSDEGKPENIVNVKIIKKVSPPVLDLCGSRGIWPANVLRHLRDIPGHSPLACISLWKPRCAIHAWVSDLWLQFAPRGGRRGS